MAQSVRSRKVGVCITRKLHWNAPLERGGQVLALIPISTQCLRAEKGTVVKKEELVDLSSRPNFRLDGDRQEMMTMQCLRAVPWALSLACLGGPHLRFDGESRELTTTVMPENSRWVSSSQPNL